MLTLLAQTILVCGSCWALWKAIRQYVGQGTLDNIPGPPSPSILFGECCPASHIRARYDFPRLHVGNLKQLYDRNGWAFHRELGEKYGPVVLLHGKFGVRAELIHLSPPLLTLCAFSASCYTSSTRRQCTPLLLKSNTSTMRRNGS